MSKPIISIWGFGPSYRKRIKLNILEALNSGYDKNKLMDYVILTDYPEDFEELAKETDKIKAIINIHEVRKDYDWSILNEYIPSSFNDEKAYASEYMSALSVGKFFSYCLHRFSLPTISKLGYSKVLMIDGDVKIKYNDIGHTITEEGFWKEFDTPENSMKGCHKETISINYGPCGIELVPARATGGSQSMSALQLASVMTFDNANKFGSSHNSLIALSLDVTEGPFRYFNLKSPSEVQRLFDVWNNNVRIIYSDFTYTGCNFCGGYMLCDYFPIGAANYYMGIKVLDFPKTIYSIRVIYEDRYFIPPRIAGRNDKFANAETQEEFLKSNQEIIESLKKSNAWPQVD
jgi:hypothetical protein